ncbi:hypothetical protein GpartN1_g4597.t1 [Galdieria partita]|uniref:Uncharacterized protein n=1 Tax=Galdieria partita TaxID=83374 RepID=A0A9C7URH5_9RHOD|nr:hypothetical protein GpartN1_g4597.t1 [Galdieria partita]
MNRTAFVYLPYLGLFGNKPVKVKSKRKCTLSCCSRSEKGSNNKGNKDWLQFLFSEKEEKLEELEYAFWNGNPPTELWKENDPEEFMERYFVENPLADEKGLQLPFAFRWLVAALKSIGSFSFSFENVVVVLVLLLILYFGAVLFLLLFQTLSRLVGTIAVSILLSVLLIWLISKTR